MLVWSIYVRMPFDCIFATPPSVLWPINVSALIHDASRHFIHWISYDRLFASRAPCILLPASPFSREDVNTALTCISLFTYCHLTPVYSLLHLHPFPNSYSLVHRLHLIDLICLHLWQLLLFPLNYLSSSPISLFTICSFFSSASPHLVSRAIPSVSWSWPHPSLSQ